VQQLTAVKGSNTTPVSCSTSPACIITLRRGWLQQQANRAKHVPFDDGWQKRHHNHVQAIRISAGSSCHSCTTVHAQDPADPEGKCPLQSEERFMPCTDQHKTGRRLLAPVLLSVSQYIALETALKKGVPGPRSQQCAATCRLLANHGLRRQHTELVV
jgi:hypothetical protein